MKKVIAATMFVGALCAASVFASAETTKKVETKQTKTTTVVKTESQADLQKEAKVTMAKAKEIALKAVPGTIKSSELEREHGKLIYSFDITTPKSGVTEVNIDAMTAAVIGTHHESAAQEAAEKKQEAKEHKH